MPTSDPEIDDTMLSTVDRAVLVDLLHNGDNVPSNIADSVPHSRSAVSKRLARMEEQGLVQNKGAGVWTLTMEGIRTAQTVREHQN